MDVKEWIDKETAAFSRKFTKELTNVETRVRRGAKLLDKKVPDWLDRVKLRVLRLESPSSCVLGQAFKDAIAGWNETGYEAGLEFLKLDDDRAADYGFTHCSVDSSEPTIFLGSNEEFDYLTKFWKAEIQRRK